MDRELTRVATMVSCLAAIGFAGCSEDTSSVTETGAGGTAGGSAGMGGDAGGAGGAGAAGGTAGSGASAGGGSGGAVALVFSSDWSTETGSTLNALRDGGVWDDHACTSYASVLSVVPAEPLGFTRTDNVLRITHAGPTACGLLLEDDAVPASVDFWGRFYFRNDETENPSHHPISMHGRATESVPIQSVVWQRYGAANGVHVSMTGADSFPFDRWFAGDPNAPGLPECGRVALENGVWYRYEWHYEFVTATTYRAHPRIYDLNGTLLFDETSYVQNDYGCSAGTDTLAAWYAASSDNVFSHPAPEMARNFDIGQEGPAGDSASMEHWYLADVALSLEGWIGP